MTALIRKQQKDRASNRTTNTPVLEVGSTCRTAEGFLTKANLGIVKREGAVRVSAYSGECKRATKPQ